jgi:hypothetical protein
MQTRNQQRGRLQLGLSGEHLKSSSQPQPIVEMSHHRRPVSPKAVSCAGRNSRSASPLSGRPAFSIGIS